MRQISDRMCEEENPVVAGHGFKEEKQLISLNDSCVQQNEMNEEKKNNNNTNINCSNDAYSWKDKDDSSNNANNTAGDTTERDVMAKMKAQGGEARGKWRQCLVLIVFLAVLIGIGAGVGIAAAPYILHDLGFTSKGLTRQSYASRLMASTSRANNHTVPKDSWVSWLQKASQKGLNQDHHAYFGTVGALVGALVGVVVMVAVVVVLYVVKYKRRRQ